MLVLIFLTSRSSIIHRISFKPDRIRQEQMKLNRCFLRDANASREKTTTTKKKNLICRCARDPQPKRNPTSIPKSKARAVVVGGGWAGFGAAWNLSKSGWQVTLVDASPAPGGLAGSADQGKVGTEERNVGGKNNRVLTHSAWHFPL